MSDINIRKCAEELKQSSSELRLLTECLSQISDLCHRKGIEGHDICCLTDLLQREQRKVLESIYGSSSRIDVFLGAENVSLSSVREKVISIHGD